MLSLDIKSVGKVFNTFGVLGQIDPVIVNHLRQRIGRVARIKKQSMSSVEANGRVENNMYCSQSVMV